MDIQYQLTEDRLTVMMPREVDHHAARHMSTEVDCLIDSWHIRTLVFDFAGTEFMDSSGIGLILGRCQQMQARSGHVIIQNPPPHIRRVMRLSGMERIASIEITNV
mgnify:CR=1 FL=1